MAVADIAVLAVLAVVVGATGVTGLLLAWVVRTHRVRHGPSIRWLAAGSFAIGAGAAVWLSISRDPGVDLPWTWALSLVLAAVMPVAVVRPGGVATTLRIGAGAAPIAAGLVAACWYWFGDGVADGAGGTEPMASVVLVSTVVVAAAISAPAVLVAGMLRAVGAPPPERPELSVPTLEWAVATRRS